MISEGFLREEAGGEEKYRFTQNLMYEIVYLEISTPRKMVLHKRTGELMEKNYDGSPKYLPEIGRHYMNAAIYDKAAHYYYKSAEYAFNHYAAEECIIYAKNAEECLKKMDRNANRDLLFNLFVTMGKALILVSRFDEVIVAFEEIIGFAIDRKAESEVKLLLCEPYLGKGDVDRARENAKELAIAVE